MSSGGTGVNQVFIDRMLGPWRGDARSCSLRTPLSHLNVVSGAIFNADDVAPAPVKATLNGTTITWSNSPSNDVIGYYVYAIMIVKSRQQFRDGSFEYHYTIGTGSYFVRAVDITGRLIGCLQCSHH